MAEAQTAAPKGSPQAAQAQKASQTSPQTAATGSGFRDLDGDEANEFLAGATRRGEYDAALTSFVESGSKLRSYSLKEGTFAGKKVRATRAGLNTAIKNAGQKDKVKVVVRKDEVALSRV